MAAPHQRASDAERDAAVGQLRAAAVQGRLDHDELEERVAAALRARTHVELGALLDDLPGSAQRRDVKQQVNAAVFAQVGQDVATRLEMKQQMNAAVAARVSSEVAAGLDMSRETVLRRKTARFVRLNLILIAVWAATGAGAFWPVWALLVTGILYGSYVIRYAFGVDGGFSRRESDRHDRGGGGRRRARPR